MDSSESKSEVSEQNGGEKGEIGSKKRDIRKYCCEYCGISRSKKALLRSHIASAHQDKVKEIEEKEEDKEEGSKEERNKCETCGACFKKPAHLKQHMVSHSLEKPLSCPIDDCEMKYARKDHLNRHLITHQGKIFSCSIEGCKSKFAIKANMKRHLIELHDDNNEAGINNEGKEEEKRFVCQELGCGKAFKFASKLKTHGQSHVKLECTEVICTEKGCLKHFSNAKCLKEHVRSCHKYINCDICGEKQLKKNIKRHMRSHENEENATKEIKCTFADCPSTFSKKSNLSKHIKAVHEDCRLYSCRISGCTKKFAYKHVRDNHENTFTHSVCQGDFEETDEVFRTGERGGRKRKCISVEMLKRKRIAVNPNLDRPVAGDYLSWLLNTD
ncbi:hypothetical protein LUZ60_017447 [Juncus effusus]|nr:hypothetical protein LUZ60_017447 [Juncus effusus]